MQENILFPDSIIVKTDLFDVHQDRELPISGFFIVECIRKIKSVDEFTEEESAEFIKLIRKIRHGMREALNINDVYLFQNEDSNHYFHFWIFPRHDWMEKFGRKIESVRPIMLYAKENMIDENHIYEANLAVAKMKEYLNDKI